MKVKIQSIEEGFAEGYWFLEASNPYAMTHAAEVEVTQEEYDKWNKVVEAYEALQQKLAGLYEDSKTQTLVEHNKHYDQNTSTPT